MMARFFLDRTSLRTEFRATRFTMQKSTLFAATILFFGPRIQAADLALGELGAAAFTSGWKTAQVDQSVAGLPLKIGS